MRRFYDGLCLDIRRRVAVGAFGIAGVILLAAIVLFLVCRASPGPPSSGLSTFRTVGEQPQGPGDVLGLGPDGLPDFATGPISGGSTTEELLGYCEDLLNSTNEYFGTLLRPALIRELSSPSDDSHRSYVTVRVLLALDHLRLGEAFEAARLLEEALAAEERTNPQRYKAELLEATAITYLKMGELDNCLTPGGALICTLPLDDNYLHGDTRGSRSAIIYLLQLLELDPEHLTARWLLNIAHTNLGTYPEDVPEAYLIPLGALESGYEIGKFDNIAAAAGLFTLDSAGGAIVEDFDDDGLLDIMWSTMDPCRSIRYFHNDGNGGFSDHTSEAGLDGQLGGLNIIQTDYNNDGWADVLVMRGGWLLEQGRMRMSLLRNDGDGTFTDVTHEAGLATPAYPSQTAAWADYDSDGDLDLFACNESMFQTPSGTTVPMYEYQGGPGRSIFPSQLFRNNGDGTFTDVAAQAGVTNFRYCKGSVWGDYDGDGYPDLYLSNLGADNRLYHNEGNGRFVDVAVAAGVVGPTFSFPTWFWDYDNDGWLDLFVAGYGAEVGDVAAGYLNLLSPGELPRLYRNDGAGGFIDVTRQVGLDRVHLPMGANFGDLDNDGFLDFYLGTGDLTFGTLVPNIMYRNDQGQKFQDVTFSGGFGHIHRGHGIAFGDLDRDGDQDVFAQMGGGFPGHAFSNALYENPGHDNRWITVRLVGVQSNRAAVGARVKVEFETPDGTRTVYRNVNSGGSFGASPFELEIGLGQALHITSLEVRWPASGMVQAFQDLPLDTRLQIREDAGSYQLLEPRRFQFSTGP